jgi:hypothetical protein
VFTYVVLGEQLINPPPFSFLEEERLWNKSNLTILKINRPGFFDPISSGAVSRDIRQASLPLVNPPLTCGENRSKDGA